MALTWLKYKMCLNQPSSGPAMQPGPILSACGFLHLVNIFLHSFLATLFDLQPSLLNPYFFLKAEVN